VTVPQAYPELLNKYCTANIKMLVVEMVSQYTNPYVIIGDGGYEVRVTSQYLVCAAVSVLQICLQCEHHILAVHEHHVT